MSQPNEPQTKATLLAVIDALAGNLETLTTKINAIFTDGMILAEGDSGQIIALKSRLERKQVELASIRKLIARLKANEARAKQAERNRK
ncbi:MAG: hypothetical protein WCP19_12845 [Chloroflexota bacterium]